MKLLLLSVFCAVLYTAIGDCPSGTCDETQTCCNGPVPGMYGCCPQPNAVCCSDGLHCCPQNTVCNLAKGQCDDKNGVVHPFLIKDPPTVKVQAAVVEKANKIGIIYCPGGYYYCQDGSTCCPMSTGQYSCCPYPSAMCCADMVHCCPYGTRCDPTSRYCLHGAGQYQALLKRAAFPMQ